MIAREMTHGISVQTKHHYKSISTPKKSLTGVVNERSVVTETICENCVDNGYAFMICQTLR